MTLRAAIYARFSTDLQNEASTADQLRICRAKAEQLGATIVAEFEDGGISGATMAARPGVQALMALAERGGVDLIIAEHTDRLSRGFEGGTIWEDLRGFGIRYVTVNQGEVTAVDQGVSSLVSVLTREEGAKKTRRGMEGVVLSGRQAGGAPYGYEPALTYDARGERVRGLLAIHEARAEVVRRIFRDYAFGASPLAIASALNAEGIAGPRGGLWRASTIYGVASAQSGILRNDLYRGVRVWGVSKTVKNRRTGTRRQMPSGREALKREAPELRIVDDVLWARVQARLQAQAVGPMGEGRGQHRPTTLLGGLIRCAECGGTMTRAGAKDHLRCGARAQQGPAGCSNTRHPSYRQIEARVLASVKANLLHPDVVAESVREFHAALKQERQDARLAVTRVAQELEEVKRRAARLIREVEDGMPWKAVAERHAELSARQGQLEAQLAEAGEPDRVVALHPGAAGVYRRMVRHLTEALDSPASLETSEAREAVRSIIEAVQFVPLPGRGNYRLAIDAHLAPVLGLDPEVMRVNKSGSRSGRSHDPALTVRLTG